MCTDRLRAGSGFAGVYNPSKRVNIYKITILHISLKFTLYQKCWWESSSLLPYLPSSVPTKSGSCLTIRGAAIASLLSPSLTFLLGLSSSHSCWPGYSLCLSSTQGYPLRKSIILFKIFAAPVLGVIILTPLMSGLVMSGDVPSDGRIFHPCLVKLRSDRVTCFGQWHVTFQGGNKREFYHLFSLCHESGNFTKNAPPAWVQLWWWKGAELHSGHTGWKGTYTANRWEFGIVYDCTRACLVASRCPLRAGRLGLFYMLLCFQCMPKVRASFMIGNYSTFTQDNWSR